jgi:ABC-type lipoprotein release transport system permease subunit
MGFFAMVVALSILAPGRRATRIDPIQALRHD